jgi:hypothetical protein
LILSQFAIPFFQILGDLILGDFAEQHHILDTLSEYSVRFVPGSCSTTQMTLQKRVKKQSPCERVVAVRILLPNYSMR